MGRLKLLGEQEGGGTDDHSALSNLGYAQSGHTGFVPSQGEAIVDILRLNQNVIRDSEGNDCIQLATASPHLTLLGHVRSGPIGVGANPETALSLNLKVTHPGTVYGIYNQAFCTSPTPSHVAIGVYGQAVQSGSGLNQSCFGLNFTATHASTGPTAAEVIGTLSQVGALVLVDQTLSKLIGYDFRVAAWYAPTLTVTDAYFLRVGMDYSKSQMVNCYGLFLPDIANATGLNCILELGPTPYLRLRGSGSWAPAAGETPLWLAEGATPTLRQAKTKPGDALGASDRVLVLE